MRWPEPVWDASSSASDCPVIHHKTPKAHVLTDDAPTAGMSCLWRRHHQSIHGRRPDFPTLLLMRLVHPCNLSNQIPPTLVQRRDCREAMSFHGNRSVQPRGRDLCRVCMCRTAPATAQKSSSDAFSANCHDVIARTLFPVTTCLLPKGNLYHSDKAASS